jgi:hypothetical protein
VAHERGWGVAMFACLRLEDCVKASGDTVVKNGGVCGKEEQVSTWIISSSLWAGVSGRDTTPVSSVAVQSIASSRPSAYPCPKTKPDIPVAHVVDAQPAPSHPSPIHPAARP